jgi:type IV pilus assembly protein PilA
MITVKLRKSCTQKHNGFTLIELLVVIIVVSILGAIALPTFLNQTARARGSEAKSNIGTINRAQQAYRFRNTSMANAITLLDVRISGKFYTYQILNSSVDTADITARIPSINPPSVDLKQYDSQVRFVSDNDTQIEFFGQVICESLQNNTLPGGATAPSSPNIQGTCVTPQQIVN